MSYNGDIDQLENLLSKAHSIDSYLTNIPIYLQALNIAERLNDLEKIFFVRLKLAESYITTGESKKWFAEMMWIFNNATDDILNSTTVIYGYTLRTLFLYKAKYIQNLHYFANIPLQKVIEMYEHVRKLYLKCNIGLRPFYSSQFRAVVAGAPLMDVEECYNNWMSSTKTRYDDCRACEKNLEIRYFIYKSDYETALIKTENLLKSKEECEAIPLTTFSIMLSPLVKIGKIQLAESYHKRSYAKITLDKGFLNEIAYHIIYMCFCDHEKAMAMFIENLSIFQTAQDDYDNMNYYACAYALFHTLGVKSGKEDLRIRFDKSSDIYNPSGVYNIKMLETYYKDKMNYVKDQFDKRNGNNDTSRLVDAKLSILDF